ncbi:MAG: HlyD protein, partial [Acidobacteria bacterium]|nr:HlyD protein [Acidobacteriota bacterium]
ADLADAEQKFARARELQEQGLVPRQGFEEAEARSKTAQANYDLALQEVRNLLATLRQYMVTSELAEKKLRDTQIRAPFSGFVKGKDVSAGQYLRVQAPVVTLVNVDWVKASLHIPEKMAAWIRVGQTVTISVDAHAERKFTGRISRINPSVDPETRAFTALARVENREGLLKPGFFFRASIPSEQVESSLTIPQNALAYAYGVYSVYVLQGNQVQQREVKIGDRAGETVEIVGGLTEGEQVAIPINQGQLLFAGASVEVAP